MTLLDKARPIPRRYWLYYLPLIAAAVGLLAFLKDAPLPWEEGVAAREAAGKAIKSVHHMISGLWYGAWACLLIIAVAMASGPLALRKLTADFQRGDAKLGRRSTPVFLIFAAIAMCIAASQMVPRLDSSLWGDEDYTARRSVVGQWERNADNELWFRDISWADTLFAYRTPNNHVLFSILARLSHSGYQPGDSPDRLHFSETRLRLPAFVFGLGTILAVGYMVAVAGYRRAALAAMFLLAFHPWFLRHAPEARGYPLAMCLGPLTLTFLIKALRRGRGVYWAGFAICEALTFYAFPGTVYLLTGINLVALGAIAFGRNSRTRGDRLTLAGRWFASSVMAALPIVFLMMPNLPQMRAYMARERALGHVDLEWLGDNLSHMATGIPWSSSEPDNPLRLALGSQPLSASVLLLIFYGLAAIGIYRLCSRRHLWIAVAMVLPYPLMLAHARVSHALLYQWYSVPLLPFVIALVALGLEYFPAKIESVRIRTFVGLAALSAMIIASAGVAGPQRKLQKNHSVEPLRESVELTREVLNPFHPDIGQAITVQFCQATRSYDPTAYHFKPEAKEPDAPDKLRALMLRADAENKPLHVNIGMPALARIEWKGLMTIVDDQALFEPLAPLFGLQDPCTRYIFRYRRNAYQAEGQAPPDEP